MNTTIPVDLDRYKRLLQREQKYLKMVGELASESKRVDFLLDAEFRSLFDGDMDRELLDFAIDGYEDVLADQEREAKDRFSACQNNPALRESHRQEETR